MKIKIALYTNSVLLSSGLAELLVQHGGVDGLSIARDMDDLVCLAREELPDVVVFELCGRAATPLSDQVTRLRHACPQARIVALSSRRQTDEHLRREDTSLLSAVVSLRSGLPELLDALGLEHDVPHSPTPTPIDLRNRNPRRTISLSRREVDVLTLVGTGLTTSGISSRLGISAKTVENHKQRIFSKLGVQSQAHAIAVATREGLISSPTLAR